MKRKLLFILCVYGISLNAMSSDPLDSWEARFNATHGLKPRTGSSWEFFDCDAGDNTDVKMPAADQPAILTAAVAAYMSDEDQIDMQSHAVAQVLPPTPTEVVEAAGAPSLAQPQENIVSASSSSSAAARPKAKKATGKKNKNTIACTWPGCPKTFAQSQTMRRHIRDVHEKKVVSSCPLCGHGCKQNIHLKNHMARGAASKCKICNVMIYHIDYVSHMKSKHPEAIKDLDEIVKELLFQEESSSADSNSSKGKALMSKIKKINKDKVAESALRSNSKDLDELKESLLEKAKK